MNLYCLFKFFGEQKTTDKDRHVLERVDLCDLFLQPFSGDLYKAEYMTCGYST